MPCGNSALYLTFIIKAPIVYKKERERERETKRETEKESY